MLQRESRLLLAGLQAVVGAEWLISGTNKVLAGDFPQGLAGALDEGLANNPNGWYTAFLHAVVLPHSVFFGYVIEIAEAWTGLVLLAGALLLLGTLPTKGRPQHRLAAFQLGTAVVAALVGAFLCVNFHFWMGDGILPAINPGQAFDEGLSLDTLLPPISLIVAWANARLLVELTGYPFRERLTAVGSYLALPFRRFRPAGEALHS